jgi:hypothetical protein
MTLYSGDEFYDDDVTSGTFDDELDCTWCGGDGIEEDCPNPLECAGPHDKWGNGCPCGPCGGTGLRSKQTVF